MKNISTNENMLANWTHLLIFLQNVGLTELKGDLCQAWPWHSESSSCEVGQTWSRLVDSSTLSRCSVAAAMTTCSANIFPIQLNAWLSQPARHSLKKNKKINKYNKLSVISFASFVPTMLLKQAVVHAPPCQYHVSCCMSMLLQAVSQTLLGHVWTCISFVSSLDRLHTARLAAMAAVRCTVDSCFAVAVVSPDEICWVD